MTSAAWATSLATPPAPDAVSHLAVGRALVESRASLKRAVPLADGAWLAHWANANTATAYLQPDHHTLSFYLQGGHAVRCVEAPAARGEPGALCLLPAGHQSSWAVNGHLQLLHLYLPRMAWAQSAERWFDLDPRNATLAERIYFRDPVLEALCSRIAGADWQAPGANLLLQQLALGVQTCLVSGHTVRNAQSSKHSAPRAAQQTHARGGLSPAARRRVLQLIEAHLADDGDASGASSLTLPAMAEAAHLSVYHFARMFKVSFACSPHAWVMQRRLIRARELLAADRLAPAAVAQQCGYTHLQHLNAALRRAGLASASGSAWQPPMPP
jgi:AraC family transcriptional regulator